MDRRPSNIDGLVAMDITIRLDRSLATPLYRQIADVLAEEIRAGRMVAGERLPTERRLAAELGVNRSTVVTAYDEVDALGLVRGYVGRGTIVERALGLDDAPVETMIWEQRALGSDEPSVRAMQEITHWLAGAEAIGLNHASTAPELLPAARIGQITREVTDALGAEALDYSPPEGTDDLRDAIAGYMTSLGAPSGADGILVTNVGQQAIDLVAPVRGPGRRGGAGGADVPGRDCGVRAVRRSPGDRSHGRGRDAGRCAGACAGFRAGEAGLHGAKLQQPDGCGASRGAAAPPSGGDAPAGHPRRRGRCERRTGLRGSSAAAGGRGRRVA